MTGVPLLLFDVVDLVSPLHRAADGKYLPVLLEGQGGVERSFEVELGQFEPLIHVCIQPIDVGSTLVRAFVVGRDAAADHNLGVVYAAEAVLCQLGGQHKGEHRPFVQHLVVLFYGVGSFLIFKTAKNIN